MHTIDGVVIAWTALNTTTASFIGTMVYTRYRNLLVLYNGSKPEEEYTRIELQEREYRIFLARQDIRRSVLRLCTTMVGVVIGFWIAWMQWNQNFEHLGTFSALFPYMLILMMLFILINEAWDRWALHCLRKMHARHMEENELVLQKRFAEKLARYDGDVERALQEMRDESP